MTTEMAQAEEKEASGRALAGASARAILLARATLFVERAAPLFVLAGAPLALILAAGLFDLWRFAGLWGHSAGLLLLLALSAVLFWRRRPERLLPTREDALARLERDGLMRHEPLQALEDEPAAGAGALWRAHLEESRRRLKKTRLLSPAPTANAVDPHGLRYAAAGVLLIGLVAAGSQAPRRLADAFLPSDPAVTRAGFADLWIEPPAYTGKAPIHLLRAKDPLGEAGEAVAAPEGSIVRIQTKPGARYRLSMNGGGVTERAEREGGPGSARAALTLTRPGSLELAAGGRRSRWAITLIDDRPPTVEFARPPASDRDGRLVVALKIDDDYGATAVALEIRLDGGQPRPLDAPEIDAGVSAKPQRIPLESLKGGPGVRAAAVDLTAHPWAGLTVSLVAVVTDEAGQEAQSASVDFQLPARAFANPLAKAVIEQRQSIAVAPDEWRRVEWALGGLTLGPEFFFDRPKDYLLLRTAMWRVNKRAGEESDATVEEFWPLALQLEDETTELARQRLDAARKALREALENRASDAEIERLTEALRAALQSYLDALAQSGSEAGAETSEADQTVTAEDLEAMLDAVRDLAKSGAANAARQALADLESLLENLRAPGRSAAGAAGGGRREGQGGQAGAVGDLIARQRSLADETFRRGERRDAPGDDLADKEGALAGDLADLMKSLDQSAAGGGEEAGKPLSRALSAMRRAEGDLSARNFDGARNAMEEAIANLRDGAEALAKAERAQAQAARGSGGQPMRDPLGRPLGPPTGQGVEVPEKSDAQRARELLEELRRRLSDGERTEDEIHYLERLLERF
ncbi:MAG: DUF4175 domain-containing protein [Parvularculaceae bacterium]